MKRICCLLIALMTVLLLAGCAAPKPNPSLQGKGSGLAAPVITVTAEDYGAIYVKWDEVNGAAKYAVYRRIFNKSSESWGDWENIESTKNTSFTDSTVVPDTRYAYRVRAVDSTKNKGEYSQNQEAKAKTPTVPFVTVSSEKAGSVTVTLRLVEGVQEYRIYRRTYDKAKKAWGDWESLATVTSGAYTDTNVQSGTKYGYRATAVKADGTETGHSNGANVTVK